MSEDDTTVNTKGLDKLLKLLQSKAVVRVGILGSNPRNDGMDNATIGAFHEFGTSALPKRSFLKEPLTDNLDKKLNSSGALDPKEIEKAIATNTMLGFLKKIGVLAEAVVAGAFGTGGYGKWPPSNMKYKHNQQTLVETTQLRNSITSDVKE